MCCLAAPASAHSSEESSGKLDALAEEIDSIRLQHGVSATAVIVVEDDKVTLEHYSGTRDWQSGQTIDRNSYFRMGSITKIFTGLALLRAQQQGVLSLDQPVSETLVRPQSRNPWAQSNPLLLAHLMEHTAGWHDMSSIEFNDKNPKPLSLIESLALHPESRIMQWPPGLHAEYSNTGPGLASFVLEQASDKEFDQYIAEHVFKPMGMTSASLLLSDKIDKQLVTGYDKDGQTPIPYWHIAYRASGGLNVLPIDMSRLLIMLLNRGQLDGETIFSRAQISRLETPKTTLAASTGLTFGYGLGVYASLHQQHVLFGHGGDADGYLAHFKYSLESGKAYLVVINAFNHAPLRAMQKQLNDYLVAELPKPQLPAAAVLDPALLESYTGQYRPASVRFPREGWEQKKLLIRRKDDYLQTSLGNDKWWSLIPVNTQHFRRRNEPLATAAFIPTDDGHMVLQLQNGNYIRD
jgi:CubicO group peptidase (beta-lactamase class C family)